MNLECDNCKRKLDLDELVPSFKEEAIKEEKIIIPEGKRFKDVFLGLKCPFCDYLLAKQE